MGGTRKKTGKERLDKYYHLAKTQGYRARSAFKLIQLNKKYNFLEKARVLIDLCAAPGGWLQVASKYMPISSLIVGVDLAPIKPIPRVITHVEDITTEKCRTTLKRDLKDWKADVVLHDGAPNVGSAWVQDAFTQSELVLSSLKLAVEFLQKGGTFVTKVFRSKDYNNLMWVFQQLFKRVEATKPPSSRNVSAEIFVVCRGFLAPKHIDPKFLDPKHVFKDVELENQELMQKNSLNDLLFPEKAAKKRKREGYEEGDYTLHHTHTVQHFLNVERESEAISILANCHRLTWDNTGLPKNAPAEEEDKEFLKQVRSHPETTEEVLECLHDLKVLGRKEYKMLLKWRKDIRSSLKKTEEKDEQEKTEEGQEENEEAADSDKDLIELEEITTSLNNAEKRLKRKRSEKMAKERRRMQLNMTTPTDIGVEANETLDDEFSLDNTGSGKAELFSLREISRKQTEAIPKLDQGEMDEDRELPSSSDESDAEMESENELDVDSEEERIRGINEDVDEMYEDYIERQYAKDPKLRVKQLRAREKPFTGASDESDFDSLADSDEENGKVSKKSDNSDSDSMSDDFATDEDEPEPEEDEESKQKSKKAALWFDQPLFKDIGLEHDDQSSDEESAKTTQKGKPDPKSEKIAKSKKIEKQKAKIEAWSSSDEEGEDEATERKKLRAREAATDQLTTAEAISMAIQMVQDGGKNKRDIIDDIGFNRYAYNDDVSALPKWFLDDETKHNKPNRPITKEAVEILRQKQRELDARPIKKVMESKARKKQKALKRMQNMRKKMNALVEDGAPDNGEDPELVGKLGQVQNMMKKAERKAREMTRRRAQLVVARGGHRGNKGRPKGVKGRYKMVDSRMKKEVKAQKRVESKKRKSKSK